MIVLAVVLSARQQALYQASSNVVVDTKNLGSSIAAELQTESNPERVLQTQANVARGPEVIRPTLANFPTRRDSKTFLARSGVTADPKADILTFAVTDPDSRTSERLARAYANSYIAYRRKLDTGALRRAQQDVEKELQDLRRTTTGPLSASAGYAELLQQRSSLRTRARLLDGIAELGPAQEAVQVQPHPLRNGVLGGILGLLLGVGIALGREQLNSRVRTVVDMEELLDLPLLGRLYEPPRSLRSRDQLAMMATPDAPESEAFQILATNIEFANLARGAKSFMIASANPSEGKSTTIANLAVTFARSGKRVVLVDLDLRRPVLHRFFDLQGTPGLTDVTLGRAWLEEALVQVPMSESAGEHVQANGGTPLGGTLELLPAGPLPPNAAEFVRSQALSDVLARLEGRADLVFVDAPAMLAVSDAINLTPKVDAIIVLARLPAVKTAALKELERILENAPVSKLGFIVTGAESDDTFTGGYGYGYGYGYRSEADRPSKTPSLP
ncbi:MAG TPA: CpsD/CapB family tyrosine-protein kinase [Solirubrobacteraceae bacterium]|nr:CpsD/CapB family tyrosine-protein kinase [Solirubrobacteraceae bacterium]